MSFFFRIKIREENTRPIARVCVVYNFFLIRLLYGLQRPQYITNDLEKTQTGGSIRYFCKHKSKMTAAAEMVKMEDDIINKKMEKIEDYNLIQVLDHYSRSRDAYFSVEFRPSIKKLPNGEYWNSNPNRLWPEDSWTGIKRIEVIII